LLSKKRENCQVRVGGGERKLIKQVKNGGLPRREGASHLGKVEPRGWYVQRERGPKLETRTGEGKKRKKKDK